MKKKMLEDGITAVLMMGCFIAAWFIGWAAM